MDKKELEEMAKNYSGVKLQREAWLAGFQRACELLHKHIQKVVYIDMPSIELGKIIKDSCLRQK